MIPSNYRLVGFVALLFLSACTTAPLPQQHPQMTPAMGQQLAELNSWHLTGKLGYRDSNNAGSAWLDWQQQGTGFTIGLRGPFGAGATRISGSEHQATLTRGNHQPITAPSATALTQHLFGWQWPVDELLFWVKGIPDPDIAIENAVYNAQGLLTQLQQSGWKLQFSTYQPTSNGLLLPQKIIGRYQQLSFTLIIKEWLPTLQHHD